LHEKDGNSVRALEVYRRYADYFPQPVDLNVETRSKIAKILKVQNNRESYLHELEKIVAIDASAGNARTPRTRYLAAQAALVLAEQSFDAFVAVRLVKPFEVNLRKKRELMETATQKFSQLTDYELGEFTAAATFYMAEIYAQFSKALMSSERPEGLSRQERQQYELAIEEQAYPFEEKAIAVHESNLKLISRGVYNAWIEKSLQKLAEFVPARYDKPEESSSIISSMETYIYEIDRPALPAASEVESAEPAQLEEPGSTVGSAPAEPAQIEEPESVQEPEPTQPQLEEPAPTIESAPAEPAQIEEPESVKGPEPTQPQLEEPGSTVGSAPAEPVQVEEPLQTEEPTGASKQSQR
jgi:hypothetical protein